MSPEILEKTHVETPYAIIKLQESARIIRQSINELPALRRRLEKNREDKNKAREIYADLQNQHRRLSGAFETANLSLLEAEQDELASQTTNLGNSIKAFNLMTPDFTKLCAVLNGYLSKLPLIDPGAAHDNEEARTTNNRIIGRLMNNVRMGYYPTCTDNLSHIVRGIEFPENVTVNLLDPCCGCGIALRSLADGAAEKGAECKTYAIELDNHRADEALTRIDRVGFGSYYHSRISNEAFHAMLLNPPYLSVMTEKGNNTRSEKSFLVDSINNLMIGGLLIYIIPYYRLTADIARILCDSFNDISVWKFTSNEFKKFRQVAIFGTKRKRQNGSASISALTSLALTPESIPELTELPAVRYQLPSAIKDVALFKGASFNKTELAVQLNKSTSISRLFQRSKLDNAKKRPLLPLSISQIGLVGGSGMINGWVDCDTPHIIKGRIVKEKRVHTEDNYSNNGDFMSTTLTETISNKLIFNLLTPAGFISLTDYGGGGIITDNEDAPSDDAISRLGHSDFNGTERFSGDDNIIESGNNSACLVLGRTVITSGAREVLSDYDINCALARHQSGDWGDVSESDRKANDNAVKHGERILSSYLSSGGEKFWIITEWDRSATTVMLPDEY